MKKHMVIKMILVGLFLFMSKAMVFSQDTGIKCKVSGYDPNIWDDIEFGNFVVSEEIGEEAVVKSYKVLETKLILNVFVAYLPYKDRPSGSMLEVMMILGKSKISPFSDFNDGKMSKSIVSAVEVEYPIAGFNKGSEGMLSMPVYSGNKKPIKIFMRCKKVKKEGK